MYEQISDHKYVVGGLF